jgi:hypothetical protein
MDQRVPLLASPVIFKRASSPRPSDSAGRPVAQCPRMSRVTGANARRWQATWGIAVGLRLRAACRPHHRGSFRYFLSSSRRSCSAKAISSGDATTGARDDWSACTSRGTLRASPLTAESTTRGSCLGSSDGTMRRAPAASSPSRMAKMDGADGPGPPDLDASVIRFDPRSCRSFAASIALLRAIDTSTTVSLSFPSSFRDKKSHTDCPALPRTYRVRRNMDAEKGIWVCSARSISLGAAPVRRMLLMKPCGSLSPVRLARPWRLRHAPLHRSGLRTAEWPSRIVRTRH